MIRKLFDRVSFWWYYRSLAEDLEVFGYIEGED